LILSSAGSERPVSWSTRREGRRFSRFVHNRNGTQRPRILFSRYTNDVLDFYTSDWKGILFRFTDNLTRRIPEYNSRKFKYTRL